MVHIRRAPIDRPEWGYEIENLRDLEPFSIACHVAALVDLEHLDEERAREILEAKLVEAERGICVDSPLWAMIGSLEAVFDQMKEEIEKRGA
jgi:hypothetical protein